MRRVKSSSSASTLTSTPITKAPKSPTPTNPNTRTFSSKYLHAPNQQLTASPAIATPSPPTPVPPQYHPEQHHKSGAGVEQLPPFTTVRLKPLKQKTKHGTVTILSTGQLMLDFIGEEYLLVISGDSNQIDFYDREGDPTKLETQRPVRSYTRSSLPAQYVKKYRYAMRFVELVRSKTPKIIFYSPQAKCILMENGPLADFEMVFYNGVKVHNSVSKQSLEIQLPPSFSSDSDVPGAPTTSPPPSSLKSGGWIVHQIDTSQPPDQLSTTLSPQLLPIFQHIQECLRQCLDIERSGRLGDNNAPAGSTAGVHGAQQHYPLILKSSNCRTVSAPTGMNRAVSPPPSYHPSSMSTYTTSVGAAEAGGGGGSESAVSATIGDKHSSAHGRSAGVHNNCGDGDGDGPKATTRNQNQCHDQHGRPPQPPIPMNRQQNNGHHTPLPPSSSCRSETGKDPAGCDEQTRMSRLDSSDMCGGSYTCVASSVVGGASSGGGSGIGGGATAFSGNGGMSWCFIPDVGWCMKMAPTAVNGSEGASNTARAMSGGGAGSGANASGVQRSGDGKFVMLFLDGVSVSVEAKGQTLVVEDSRDRKGGLCDGGAGGSTADDAKRLVLFWGLHPPPPQKKEQN
ncbi:Serine/threonine-protein kinase plk4 [Quaeritorhiza haematococci]|nr:Serine/threonine-protein kinase plk4 [Quaeritorhiza haematococci]